MSYPDIWDHTRPRKAGCVFLDSGAHSLYTEHCIAKKHRNGYRWFETKAFRRYVDWYAGFVKRYAAGIDYYANVDVIFNPGLSWKVLKYLEREHGLTPVPVIHFGTDMRWVDKHLDAGYEFLGIGGLGQEVTQHEYHRWADMLFARLCPASNGFKPVCRTHGFAMTSWALMVRYPWWSVDSASWAKAAAFGSIYVPHRRRGEFVFTEPPYVVVFSETSKARSVPGKHYLSLRPREQEVVRAWLAEIQLPLGGPCKWCGGACCDGCGGAGKSLGALNHYGTRAVANVRFYERLCSSLPPYPQPFRITPTHGFFK